MHAHAAVADTRPPFATPMGLGVLLFLVSEAFLFGSLFIIYYYLRAHAHGQWPPEGVEGHLALGATNTFLLFLSSVTAQEAVVAARGDRAGDAATWLGFTCALGVAFLCIKGFEWLNNGFGPWDHAYGSAYYALTGFHALHLAMGLLLFGALILRARAGRVSARRHLAVELGASYWHFVDAIWLAVFATIYLVR